MDATDGKAPRPWWRRKRVLIPAGLLVLAIPGILGAGGGEEDPDTQATSSIETTIPTTAAPTTTTEPPAYVPKPADFQLGVVTVERSCYGSAGCNVTVDIEVSYQGQPLDPSDTWQVIYEVRGGENGAEIGNFEVQGERHTDIDEEMISTGSSYTLTAVATSVRLA